MRLFLVRHGQTEWNVLRRAQGHTDIPLDAVGLNQAASVAAALGKIPVDRVVSSDLLRARQTADAIASAKGLEVDIWPDLRERGFGVLEGADFETVRAEIARLAAEENVPEFAVTPKGGENWRQVWDRVSPAAKRLRAMDGDTVVVAHGGTCSLLAAHLIGGGLEASRGFRFGNGTLTEFHRRPDGTLYLVRYDDASHLEIVPLPGSTDGVPAEGSRP